MAIQKLIRRSAPHLFTLVPKFDFLKFFKALFRNIKVTGYKSPKLKLPRFSLLKFFLALSAVFLIFAASGIIFSWQFVVTDLPSPQSLSQRKIPVSTKIYDRNGTLLYSIYKDENRTPVALTEIPPQVKLATIAAEDSEFYTHSGFSIRGIARALVTNFKERS